MKQLSIDINLDDEVQAIVAFLTYKWEPLANLTGLISAIRDVALHDARGWVDRFDAGSAADDLANARRTLLDTEVGPDADYYDAYQHILDSAFRLGDTFYNTGLNLDGPWNYEKNVKRLAWRLTGDFPGMTAWVPTGYAQAKELNCHDLCEAYEPALDRELFNGSKVEGILSGTLPMRVALPYVLVEQDRGREPWITVIGAVYAQFLGIASFKNTAGFVAALSTAFPTDTPAVVFALPDLPENPFLRALVQLSGPLPTELAYKGALRQRHARTLSGAAVKQFMAEEPEQISAQIEHIKVMGERRLKHWPGNQVELCSVFNALLFKAT